MHRLFLGLSLSFLAATVALTGCGRADKPPPADDADRVSPGEARPIPPGEARPIPKGDPADSSDDDTSLTDTRTDPDTLPVLPTLSAPAGEEKYEQAVARAFLLMAEKKDAEALAALEEARAAQETDFVKAEIERVRTRMARTEAAQKAADDIKEVLDAGKAVEAAKLAGDALDQYGDSDHAATFTALKQQADALASAGSEDRSRKDRLLQEAEAARKANNLRTAVLSYDQAVAGGADPGPLKDTYQDLRTRLVRYDENRSKAAELRKDPYQLEHAVTSLKVAAENWDTPQVRQEISETEIALNNRRDRVAVVDFETIGDVGVPRAGHIVAEELVGHMRPRFDVVERGQVRALLEEMKLDHDDLVANDTGRTEFGRLARARYVVLGSVSRLGGLHVNARLVDTHTGLVVQTARIVAATPEDMSNRLPALGRMLQMNDTEKRDYERRLAEQARPVAPPPATAEIPPPPPLPDAVAAPAPPPAPIVVYSPRPPVYGQVVVADFDGFRVVDVAVAAPPPVVVVEAPPVVRDRAFFVAVEVGDNCFRRGDFRLALRHFEFALSLNPGHHHIRLRVQQCRPLCPPPVVVVPVVRPRLVVLPFPEFRDPFAIPSSIPPGTGEWAADAIAPYFHARYDVVDRGELFWWMGRLGLTLRDVLTNPHARLCLGRALGARYFLMGSLREVASFDASTHLIDAELNCQTHGARIRVRHAGELRYRLAELAHLTMLPPQQQVVVVEQQQVVHRKVVAAQLEIKKGNFRLALGFYKEVLDVNPHHAEARSMLVQVEFRSRRAELEAARHAAWQREQAAVQAQRDRQIALAAATAAVRLQARRDEAGMGAGQRQQLAQQQLLAQQNLIAQAQLARRQNNLERRVALLESANNLRRDDAVVQQLAEAKAELAAERQKRLAAEQAARESERKRQKEAELVRVEKQLALEREKQQLAKAEREKAEATRVQAEYDRFVDQGRRAMEANRYPLAVSAFQNARRLKPSPEVEQLVSSALTAQAKAEAEKKGTTEKAKLEAQLAQEEQRRKQLEEQNAKLKAKYQAALAKAQDAMRARRYEEAVTSYRLASQTMQTDEAATGLKQAEAELVKAKAAADAEAKKKAEARRTQAAVDKKVAEGRTALAAKQYEKAVGAFRVAAGLKPGDVEIQKALAQAELVRDEALAAARKQKTGSAPTIGPAKKSAAAAVPKKDPGEVATRKVQAAYELAMRSAQSAMTAKKYDAAIRHATEAVRLKPDDAAATQLLASAKQADAAADAAALEGKKKQDAYLVALREASSAYAAKRYEAAIQAAKEALAHKPGDAPATKILTDAQKAQAAATTTAAEARRKQEAYDAAVASGRAALTRKDFDTAIKAFNQALQADPGDPTATALLKQARDAQSAAAADAKRKELYDAWLDRGEKLMDLGRYGQAVEAYQNALKAMPGDPKATKGLADARAAAAPKKEPVSPKKDPALPKPDPKPKDPLPKLNPRPTEALPKLNPAPKDPVPPKKAPAPPQKEPGPKVDPNAARAADLLRTARAQEDAGQYAEAARTYQEVLRVAPANAQAKRRSAFCQHMDQGTRLLAAGKRAEAAASFQQAVQIDPTDTDARRLLQQARPAKKKK